MTINVHKDKSGNLKITKERGFVVDEFNIYCNTEDDTEQALAKLIHEFLKEEE